MQISQLSTDSVDKYAARETPSAMPVLFGTVSFVCPASGRTWDTSPVYKGEDPFGSKVLARAERAYTMLRNPQSDPGSHVLYTAVRRFRHVGH